MGRRTSIFVSSRLEGLARALMDLYGWSFSEVVRRGVELLYEVAVRGRCVCPEVLGRPVRGGGGEAGGR